MQNRQADSAPLASPSHKPAGSPEEHEKRKLYPIPSHMVKGVVAIVKEKSYN